MSLTSLTCPACDAIVPEALACIACGHVLRPPTPDAWHYAHGKQKRGPVSFADLQRLVATGVLQPADMLLQQGTNKWVAVSSLPGLVPVATVRPGEARPAPRQAPPVAQAKAAAGGTPWWQAWQAKAGAGGLSTLVLLSGFMYWSTNNARMRHEREQHDREQLQRQQEQLHFLPPPVIPGGTRCQHCQGSGKLGLLRCPDCGGRGWFPPPPH
jgi:hypothetical protein